MGTKHAVIVGGGFAGLECAQRLIANRNVRVTLIDKNNYNQFTPLLYQVAASGLSSETAATSFRHYFEGQSNIEIKMALATDVNPRTGTVATEEGESYQGDFIVLAAGSTVNFFDTVGAQQYSFPIYTLADAERLRSRIIAALEDADRNPKLIDQGLLNFVIVGAGPTGTEIAGAVIDMIYSALPKEYPNLSADKPKVYIVNEAPQVLNGFSKKSQDYVAETLKKRGVQLALGLLLKEASDGYVVLSNGEKILTKTIIWAGGLKAAPLASRTGLPQGHGGRINIKPDLTVEGFPNIYALGDFANIPGPNGDHWPQLAAVAKQSGAWAARNILAQIKGKQTTPFKYNDKGIMAIIGRNAAVVELGTKRRELTGIFAFMTWLVVHAALLPTFLQKMQAFLEWTWDYFSKIPAVQILDRSNAARINWNNKTKPPS